MWPIGDEEGTFDYSARRQGILFSSTPTENELRGYLLENYVGTEKELSFDALREETWSLPFREKDYRTILKRMEQDGVIIIRRIQSKKTGLQGADVIIFRQGEKKQ